LNNFTYYNPTKIYFGRNTIKNIGREMREQGVKKALLVCGRQSIFSNGVYDQVSSSLIGWYVDFIRFSGIQPNPLLSKVEGKREKCEVRK
jgi:alcohol dehydrogenase YqhD (iron-dependent ADH family)